MVSFTLTTPLAAGPPITHSKIDYRAVLSAFWRPVAGELFVSLLGSDISTALSRIPFIQEAAMDKQQLVGQARM